MTTTRTTFHIVGDAFVDLICFLNDSNSLPEAGGDSRLDQPVKAYAGGSGLNTTTHLQSLSKNIPKQRHNATNNNGDGGGGGTATSNNCSPVSLHKREILLHTCLNPNDQYGQLLEKHAQEHGFPLINCHHHHQSCSSSSHPTNGGGMTTFNGTTNHNMNNGNSNNTNSDSSTGHCIIIVAGGERSFMTHVGCLEHFKATDLDMNRILGETNHHHHQCVDDTKKGQRGAIHIHIAGYFNLSGFHDGNLKSQLEAIRAARHQQCQRQQQHPTVFSLVAQHDATRQWDGDLENVVPLLDFLILNELEASHIVQSGRQRRQQRQRGQQGAPGPKLFVDKNNDMMMMMMMNGSSYSAAVAAAASAPASSTCSSSNSVETTTADPDEWISYFGSFSNDCIVVVTRGALGAIAFGRNGIIAMVEPAIHVSVIVDPTGAGDAFAAGFLHGIWEHYWQNEEQDQHQHRLIKNTQRVAWSAEAIHHGLMWGCAAGTATVTIRGASIPPRHEDIQSIYEQQQEQHQEKVTDNHKVS